MLGQVIFSGQLQFWFVGVYLEVFNLVFCDGWVLGGEVVFFCVLLKEWVNYSWVIGVVIDCYNKLDCQQLDNWVGMYGQYNCFDYNQLVGKINVGIILVVVCNVISGFDNCYCIDYNWFGLCFNLGSNGGEILCVGISYDLQFDLYMVVENNWFDYCDGEVEIVFNKFGGNLYCGNVFFVLCGLMVLCYGYGNVVECNVFLGNNKVYIGGVWVINCGQIVCDNYFENLVGDNFVVVLVVMVGICDVLLNCYEQVVDVVIECNSFINVCQLFLGVGLDDECNVMLVNSCMMVNLFIGDGKQFLLCG